MTKSIRSFALALAVLAGTLGATAAPALAAGWRHPGPVHFAHWRGYGWPFFSVAVPPVYPFPLTVAVPGFVPPPPPPPAYYPAPYPAPPMMYAPPQG
jgi:hypothetical protein